MTRLYVPELDGTVGVRSITAAERAEFLECDGALGVVWLCLRGLADAQGCRIFADADTESLGEVSYRALRRMAEAVKAESGLSVDALARARARLTKDPEAAFYIRLSVAYSRPVVELLDQLSGRDIVDLMAFEQLHGPLPDRRGDYHAAQIVNTLAEINRDRKKHPQPTTLAQFLLNFTPPVEKAPATVGFDPPAPGTIPADEEPWQKHLRLMRAAWGPPAEKPKRETKARAPRPVPAPKRKTPKAGGPA